LLLLLDHDDMIVWNSYYKLRPLHVYTMQYCALIITSAEECGYIFEFPFVILNNSKSY